MMLCSSFTFGSPQSLWPAKLALLSVATCTEKAIPRVRGAHVVDRAVHAELLPHEPGVVVRDRPVAVVRVAESRALSEITVLTGARAGDHGPAAVPAHRLPSRGEAGRGRAPHRADGEAAGLVVLTVVE